SSSSGSSRLPRIKLPPSRPPILPRAHGRSSLAPRPSTGARSCCATPTSPAITSPSIAGPAKRPSAPSARTTTPNTRSSIAPATSSPAARSASAPTPFEPTSGLRRQHLAARHFPVPGSGLLQCALARLLVIHLRQPGLPLKAVLPLPVVDQAPDVDGAHIGACC